MLYEPGPGGQRRLVALEYVIPKADWTAPDPPVLLGQEFTLNAFEPLGRARLGVKAQPQRDVRRLEPERQLRQRGLRLGWGPSLMPRFIIEREIPDAAALPPADLKAISQRSCAVLRQLGPDIQWLHSFVTEDKITCVYIAPNAELIREHARRGGFPADRVLEVAAIIDPTTAESNGLAATALP